MNFIKTPLDGVLLVEPRIFNDERGYFFESYNEAVWRTGGIDTRFIQDNQSKSSYGVIRGLHCQTGEHAQAKLVRVLQGKILDVAVDIRENSPTYGQHVAYELCSDKQNQIFIPRGFLHGFSVLSDTAIIAYKCDAPYQKSAENGVRYDDQNLAINWQIPTSDVILSDRDNQLGLLNDDINYRG